MREITIEKIKSSFPFEPYLPSHMNYEECEAAKQRMSKYIISDKTVIDLKLENIYMDMVKSNENISIYNQLISNKDKLIYVTDGSYIFTPLIYDENYGTFHFQKSCDMNEFFGWDKIKMSELMAQILEMFGGLSFRIFYLAEPCIFSFYRNAESYSGKQIKSWCDNNNSKDAKAIKEKYFSKEKMSLIFTALVKQNQK